MRWFHALLALLGVAASCSLGWAVDYSKEGALAKDVFPVVDVEFPPKTPGGSVVKKRYPLAGSC